MKVKRTKPDGAGEMNYTQPNPETSVLITIDVQQDFVWPKSPVASAGAPASLGNMKKLTAVFRAASRPIIHVVRIYLTDGSNVDTCRRSVAENGEYIVAPDSPGAELVDELKPDHSVRLTSKLLLSGGLQLIGGNEWIMYKPRWDAFYETPLEGHLRDLDVDTAVFCGCNFPNCPRASIYGATMRDFRVVMATDAVTGAYEVGLDELKNIGVKLMNTQECSAWLTGTGGTTPVTERCI